MIFADATYTSITPAALEIIRRRLAQKYLRFFGAAFTTSGEFRYKEAEPWTEIAFWFNTQNADPNVLYVVTYDGTSVYQGPVSRDLAPPAPAPRPPTPSSAATAPRPTSSRPAWVTPVLAIGGALGGLMAIGLIWRATR